MKSVYYYFLVSFVSFSFYCCQVKTNDQLLYDLIEEQNQIIKYKGWFIRARLGDLKAATKERGPQEIESNILAECRLRRSKVNDFISKAELLKSQLLNKGQLNMTESIEFFNDTTKLEKYLNNIIPSLPFHSRLIKNRISTTSSPLTLQLSLKLK